MSFDRIMGLVAAVVGIAISFWWTLQAAEFLEGYAFYHLSLGGPLSKALGPRPDAYDSSVHIYYLVLALAPQLAVGFIAYCLLVDYSLNTRLVFYCLLLFLLMPLNLFNYNQGDVVLSRSLQVLLNGVVIFCGLVVIVALWNLRTGSMDAKIAKLLAIALLLFAAVLVPLLFTSIWALVATGVIDNSPHLTWPQITAFCGLVSTVIAVAKFGFDVRKEMGDPIRGKTHKSH